MEKYTNDNRLRLEKLVNDISGISRSATTSDTVTLWILIGELEKIRGTEQTNTRQFIDQSQIIANKFRSFRISYERKIESIRENLTKLGVDGDFLNFFEVGEIIAQIRIRAIDTEQIIERKIDSLKLTIINKINSIYIQSTSFELRQKSSKANNSFLSSANVNLINAEIKDALMDKMPDKDRSFYLLGEKYRKLIRLNIKLKECKFLSVELEWMRAGCNRLVKYSNAISNQINKEIILQAKFNIDLIIEKKV